MFKKIPVKREYALRAIFDLATQRSGVPVKTADIARRQKIPQKFLEVVLASLKQGGFVESRRGAEGGYLLTRPAEAITVGEVLRFFEGPSSHKGVTKMSPCTPFTDMWQKVDLAVSSVVDFTTFAELVRGWKEMRMRYVPNWEI